ncbi:OmpA family protein [Flavobacterium psychrotrophum]|uniref:OmpA family protein n=1 Tax=Flavobacterium psychrotrophum TaxID=2294119 RepID=UPI000E31C9D1|nr:OmpA family protein [Flavobacterium psychrotrophum]
MKKAVLPLLLLCLSQGINAQEAKPTQEYDKWSIEVGAGINKPGRTFTEGYRTSRLAPITGELGVRYMFNNKFGLKLDAAYNQFKNADNSLDFKTTFMRLDLQGVINVGRILNFEDWTNRFGLLLHGGAGVFRMTFDDNALYSDAKDHGLNLIGGLTGQLRLSNSVVLTGDFTTSVNGVQNFNFDGNSTVSTNVVDGVLMTGTVGLTFYLGSKEKHADWYVYSVTDQLNELDKRVGDLETMMNDSDKDGVPDYLDAEPNTIAGVAVDSKGRNIDRNGNGVPDELESYLEKKEGELKSSATADLTDLINGGYVNVYFDFNADQPNPQSVNGVNFLIKYLKENPSKSADVIGYADEIGNTEYNKALSARRAENVKKILVDAGINASRLNIVGNGEDASVSKDSKYARQTVRRVTFIIK